MKAIIKRDQQTMIIDDMIIDDRFILIGSVELFTDYEKVFRKIGGVPSEREFTSDEWVVTGWEFPMCAIRRVETLLYEIGVWKQV